MWVFAGVLLFTIALEFWVLMMALRRSTQRNMERRNAAYEELA